jgi:hypothetical protein
MGNAHPGKSSNRVLFSPLDAVARDKFSTMIGTDKQL